MFFDTHNHSQFSFDGQKTSVEDSVKASIEKGLGGLCFTDHCDFYVPDIQEKSGKKVPEVFDVRAQQAEIDRVAGKVAEGAFGRAAAKKFKVLKGIEMGLGVNDRDLNRNLLAAQDFDQVTVSVHYLEDTDPYYGHYYKGKNWKEAYGRYLETLLREMKWLGDFDVMGHFDYVVRYAPYPKESILYKDFPALMDEILRYLAENGKGLEINTKSYKAFGLRTPQLDRDILVRFLELGGEVICLGSDSHAPEQVAAKFDYYAQYVKMFGFRRLGHFEGRKLKMVTI